MSNTFDYPGFDTIKRYYDLKLYDLDDMKLFTDGNAITKSDFKKIVGKSYKSVFEDKEEKEEDKDD